jgi:hypothetical protein
VDAASAALGEKILGPEQEISDEPEFDSTLRSRVLKDPFHVFNMFYISATHSLRPHFTRELRDAIFVPDKLTSRALIAGVLFRILHKHITPYGIPHLNGFESGVNTLSQPQRSSSILFLVFFALMVP